MNIADAFAEHARTRPDHPAVEDGDRVVTYGELEALANTAAANLLSEGIEQGDIVGIALPDSVEQVALIWALARVGATMFMLDAELLRSGQETRLSGCRLKAVVVEEAGPDSPSETEAIPLAAVFRNDPKTPPLAVLDGPGDQHPLFRVQSSGTTGTPKAFMMGHGQIIGSLRCYQEYFNWSPETRYVAFVGMSFFFGCKLCLAALFLGATVVISRTQRVGDAVELVRKKLITAMVLIPVHLRPLLAFADANEVLFPGLQSMYVTTAAVSPRERWLARERLSPHLMEVYGSNELSCVAISKAADMDAHPNSVGRVVDDVAVQIVDPDDKPVAAGQVGLIRLRSDRAATGYLDNPEADAWAFRDGWFYPMDLAAMNEDGYIFLKGRADDIINCDGIKFYLIEVENALLLHPDVTAAAVFGWRHPKHGEVAVAVVTTGAPASEEDFVAFCKRQLAPFKAPRVVMVVPEMPRNPMGKILKGKLKADLARELANRT